MDDRVQSRRRDPRVGAHVGAPALTALRLDGRIGPAFMRFFIRSDGVPEPEF